MEINIPSDVIVSELMKDYYTKKEVEDLLDTMRESILSEIKSSARISFDNVAVEEKPKAAKKKTTKKQEVKTLELPEETTAEPSSVLSFEPITKSAPVVNNGVEVIHRPAGKKREQPELDSRYDFLNVNPAIFGNG